MEMKVRQKFRNIVDISGASRSTSNREESIHLPGARRVLGVSRNSDREDTVEAFQDAVLVRG